MNSRERVLAALNHQEADRVAIHDYPWLSAVLRWHKEGLPAHLTPFEYFDYEIVRIAADTTPRFPERIVEETEDFIIHTTRIGQLRRDHKDFSTTPEIIESACKNREDWEEVKKRLTPSRDRVDWEGEPAGVSDGDDRSEQPLTHDEAFKMLMPPYEREGLKGCQRAREDGKFICYWGTVGFDKIQKYTGLERLLIAIATEPDWVRDMYETDARLHIQMYEIMRQGGFEFDGVMLSCDIGYVNGPFISPRHYEQQLHPVFKELFGYFRSQGLPVILHADGNVKQLIPFFIEEGLTCLNPIETKAGMDLVELKQEYGDRLALFGGIDVRAIADPDPSVIEDEVRRKVPVAMKGGGYIYDSDADGVGHDVSFQQYERVIELVLQYGTY